MNAFVVAAKCLKIAIVHQTKLYQDSRHLTNLVSISCNILSSSPQHNLHDRQTLEQVSDQSYNQPIRQEAQTWSLCAFIGCKSVAQRIVGDCGECGKEFCSIHRMLESHECVGIANAAASAEAQNTAKLEGEATKYNKVDRDYEWCMNKMSGAKGFGEDKQ
ncbi:hypothetical protein LTR78_003279 [Recurvomyces mirabilis]|uniref:AN1-type domain-containing protein n=1 Tax=Recurvomyces mirabilis TaxID=574656 RepID=A0AAE1C421_9PEZI|nr:hypothetical protein LTR78_003279 [Recurvomyces mirabilis]KAK5156903.1 hypothetical protein LTS14_004420 [Recurvomyces mirabilis]